MQKGAILKTFAQITGTGSHLPGKTFTNDELAESFGKKIKLTNRMIGSNARYWATDIETGKLLDGVTNANVAAKAAKNALDNSGLKASDIQLIILVTCTPDYPLPPTVTFVQEKLKIKECATLELRSGCSGFGQAVSMAKQYIENNTYQKVMIIGSELISPLLNLKKFKEIAQEMGSEKLSDAMKASFLNISMFADGAGALILEGMPSSGNGDREGIFSCLLNSVGTEKSPGVKIRFGGTADLVPRNNGYLKDYMMIEHDFENVYRHTPQLVRRSMEELLKKTELTLDQVDKVIPPQANAKMTMEILNNYIKEKGGNLPKDKFYFNFHRVGNTSSASIPIALDEASRENELNDGDTILLLPAEASKWLYSGIALKWRKN